MPRLRTSVRTIRELAALLSASGVLILAGGTLAAEALDSAPPEAAGSIAGENMDAMLKQLRPVLSKSDRPTRIYYESKSCASESVRLPPIHIERPSGVGLSALKQAFRGDASVRVEDTRGVFRINIGNPPMDILRTKIARIDFDKFGRYEPAVSILTISSKEDVFRAGRRLKIRQPFRNVDILLGKIDRHGPHLRRSMVNVTMEQALDEVARTFDGVVAYGACAYPGRYFIEYFDLDPSG